MTTKVKPYICPRCSKPTNSTISRTDTSTRYCSQCYNEMSEADAKLGRLVHKALQSAYNLRLTKSDDGLVFGAALYINGPRVGDGTTLLTALEAAGIKDE